MYHYTYVLSVPEVSGFDSTEVHKEVAAKEYESACSDDSKKAHNYIKSVAIANDHITCLNIQEPGVNEI